MQICAAFCYAAAVSATSTDLVLLWERIVSALTIWMLNTYSQNHSNQQALFALAEKQKNKKYAMNVDEEAQTDHKGIMHRPKLLPDAVPYFKAYIADVICTAQGKVQSLWRSTSRPSSRQGTHLQ